MTFVLTKIIIMKRLLQSEQIAQFGLSLIVLYLLPHSFSWWAYLLLFFAPDLAMVGYFVNTKVGAWTYNLAHHKLVCAIIIVAGIVWHQDALLITGILFYGHSAFDRMMGYGLKYPDAFQHTHLGWIGKNGKKASA